MDVMVITLLKDGGMVHYTSQLANNLVKKVNVDLIVPEDCNLHYFNNKIYVHTVKTPCRGNWMSKDQLGIIKLFKIITKINPDIIHISGSYMWLIGLFFFLKLKRSHVVVTLHDVNVHYGENTFINRLTNYFYIKIADYLFVHGQNLKKEILKRGINKNNVFVIPHGNYSFFTEFSDKETLEDGSILFFGRIEDYKGLKYLLESIPLIENNVNHFNVIIAGRGSLDKYGELIKRTKNLEIINRYIEDELVAQLFQRASVVVMPYVEGSQSGIIPIAYSFKKPVVVTNVGSISEVVEDGITGFIVPPRDSKALAESLITLLNNNELRKQMGENSYRKMKKELSWDNIANKTVEIYKKKVNG